MEKAKNELIKLTKLRKLIKVLIVVVYIVVFLGVLTIQLWVNVAGVGFSVSSLIYWLILLAWLGFIWQFKWGCSVTLIFAFVLFVIAAAFAIFGLRGVGETVMRVSFIGWLVGIGQALVEYKKENDKKSE